MTKSRDEYLRVTHVLYPFSGLDKIDSDVLNRAADRGTRVHKACEGIILGLGELGIDEEIKPYVESFKAWWATNPEVVEVEKRFYCDEHQITGQVDLIIKTEEGLCIVDLKSSYKPSPTWEAQGSAYAYLAKKSGYDIKKVVFLHLQRNGAPAKSHQYPIDDSFFLSILRVFKHFFQR